MRKGTTYLLVRRKDGETGAGRLVLVGGTESPKGNGSAAKLGEPALQLGLSGIVREAAHVEHLAALSKKGSDVGAGVHGTSEDVGVFLRGLRLADQATEDSGKRDSLLHGAAWRSWGKSLQVKGEIVLDGGRRLHGLDFESGTDISQGARAEGQRLGMVRLPALVLGAQVKGARVLQVRRQHDGLISGLARQLHTEIPRVQRDKGKFVIL